MAYDTNIADRVREYLAEIPEIDVEEKLMFGVLNFMVNEKTCVCVSDEKLMLRFDPIGQEDLYEKDGYETMLMKGKEYKGYCYIDPFGFKNRKDFEFYLDSCLDYNKVAKSSKKREKKYTTNGK